MIRRARRLAVVVVIAIVLSGPAPRAQDVAAPAPRFDERVRADFFAGFRGDTARLERGMQLCERALAHDPDQPDALAWHGAGLMFGSGQAARRQDFGTAQEQARRGREEIERAGRLAPDSVSVMIVRATVFSAAARSVPDPSHARQMRESAVAAFERLLALQTPNLDRLSEHARGELLGGLAEGWLELGRSDKARGYLERIVEELPGTRYQVRARAWLEDGAGSAPLTCLTCHH
jgi:tetratricopeptide (TPR) repeat protein